MVPDYRRALGPALRERHLWTSGLLASLALSEAWRVLLGWEPEYAGERTSRWLRGPGGWNAGDPAPFIPAAMAACVVLKAAGYLGEMALVRQVAPGEGREIPGFGEDLASSRRRRCFAATLLPLDAPRIALIYLPALIIALWEKWDPRFDRVGLYLLALPVWLLLLFAVIVPAGITAMLASRLSLLRGVDPPRARREGWALFRARRAKLVVVVLQALAAEVVFTALARPILALVPWVGRRLGGAMDAAPGRWLHAALGAGVLAGQKVGQRFKSSRWTLTFLGMERGRILGLEDGPKENDLFHR